ncbi:MULTISPECIES: YcfL family protein [Providencia]|uniref:YcfL family protein n=1 Tax=Providencia TaxID=586 RepID=UPI001F11959D|nr:MULTISPECIES: YcfL family protein [Providencia]
MKILGATINRIALLATVVAALSGCLYKKPQGLVFNEQQRVIMEPVVLAQGIIVENPIIRVENHQHVATINVSNVGSKAVNIAYRLYWYDKQGLRVDTSAVEEQLVLPSSTEQIRAITSSPRADNLRIHIFLSPKAGE